MKLSAERQEVIRGVLDGTRSTSDMTLEEAIELQSRLMDLIATRTGGVAAPSTLQ